MLLFIVSSTFKRNIYPVNIKALHTVLIIIYLYMYICNKNSQNVVEKLLQNFV